jgi:signal transduction histidine kinase
MDRRNQTEERAAEVTEALALHSDGPCPVGGAFDFNAFPLPCRVVDAAGRIVWRSGAYGSLVQSERVGNCCESLGFERLDGDCLSLRTIRTARAGRQTRWLGKVYVAIQSLPLPAPDGRGLVSFEIFQDITAEKRLEGALIQQQELLETINKAMIEINHHLEAAQSELETKNRSLEDANKQLRSLDLMKDEFISIVSHELKAPLTSIKGSVELIRITEKDSLGDTGRELLSICSRSTDRLNRLVQDLLDMTRIESGRLCLEFERFNALELIEECFSSVRPIAEGKGLVLVSGVPGELELEADRERLTQVLVNLINNAIKFTDQGSITAEVEDQWNQVVFRVRDTGIGIPAESQSQIFEKFAQVASALHHNSGGTGLGLSIARGIVREHGGDISVESEPGQGSCFTFTVPQPPGKGERSAAGPLD